MANVVTNTNDLPDFTKMSVPERSEWLLAQLRKLPGERVAEGLLRLKTTGSLIPVMASLAPGLTKEQLRAISTWLASKGLRRSDNNGGGKFTHYIMLAPESDASPGVAPTGDAGGTPASDAAQVEAGVEADLANAGSVLERATATIVGLRARLAEAEQEAARLCKDNERLAGEVKTLQSRLTLTQPFYDGVSKLEEVLGE